MDFCDGNLGKITNNLMILDYCDDLDLFVGKCGKIVSHIGGF